MTETAKGALRVARDQDTMTAGSAAGIAAAYLVSEYPKLSHEFVAREIRTLRSRGARIRTFSARPSTPAAARTDHDRDELRDTVALLGDWRALVAANLGLIRRRPGAWLAGLRAAWRTNAPTVRARLWQLFYLGEAVYLVQEMRSAGLRHVHVHFANNGADIARLAAVVGTRAEGRPWSWSMSMHGSGEFWDVRGVDLAAKAESAAFVACITDFCRSQLMTLTGPEHWSKLHVVPMSVEPHRYPPMFDRRRGRSGPARVLFVGRLVPEKGLQVLLDAVADLGPSAVEVRIVGDGPRRAWLDKELRSRGLEDVVKLLGALGQDELPEQYAWADVFCLPSFTEGLPVVLFEAMATGLPVITSRITGIPELVHDGRTGLLVTPGRADQVREALHRLASDEALRDRIGRAAVAAVHELHAPERAAARLLPLLRSVAAQT